jgi:hypothetical protein
VPALIYVRAPMLSAKQPKVLVAEDDTLIAMSLSEMLSPLRPPGLISPSSMSA